MRRCLYPCQAIFLTAQARCVSPDCDAAELEKIRDPFVLVEGAGMLVRERLNAAEIATLEGLAHVLRRIPASAPVRYLEEREVGELLCADVYHYRERVEDNCASAFAVPHAAPFAGRAVGCELRP